MVVIVFFIVVFCVEIMDVVRFLFLLNVMNNVLVLEFVGDKVVFKRLWLWFIIDMCIIFWFCVEYIFWFVLVLDKIGFIFFFLVLIDLVVIIFYFFFLIFGEGYVLIFFFMILRIFWFLWVVWLLKFICYVVVLRILGNIFYIC